MRLLNVGMVGIFLGMELELTVEPLRLTGILTLLKDGIFRLVADELVLSQECVLFNFALKLGMGILTVQCGVVDMFELDWEVLELPSLTLPDCDCEFDTEPWEASSDSVDFNCCLRFSTFFLELDSGFKGLPELIWFT
eukprot:CAMPEP_0116941952 /NCGR_PEP_ID=MMETSP0467-20121206/34298_1 /TAXON_ID=283647 /ORGANISM="Mesodinium pulex, Strain SPMC105" /LENGTH=137 /DNA_ID=CAMNT_0004624841 /DNA_START=654 /DNA_END=1067 /DNA_ORIENTATION=-